MLSGDALVVAVMHERGFTHLASHDADFEGGAQADAVRPGLTGARRGENEVQSVSQDPRLRKYLFQVGPRLRHATS